MASLTQSKRFELGDVTPTLRADFAAFSASEADIASTIQRVWQSSGYMLDPHTACGAFASAQLTGTTTSNPHVVLATASPAKFPDAMVEITNMHPALPARLAHLLTDAEHFDVLPNDLNAVQTYVATIAQSQKAGAA